MPFKCKLVRVVSAELRAQIAPAAPSDVLIEQFELNGSIIIGRRPDLCQLVIRDKVDPEADNVSRRHAQFDFEPNAGKLIVTDLGSMNGSSVNGVRIPTQSQLADGDIVGFGGVRFQVCIEDLDPLPPVSGIHETMVGTAQMQSMCGDASIVIKKQNEGDAGQSMIG